MQLLSPPERASKLQSAGIAVAGLGSLIALLYYGRAFCITFVVAVILAFMLEPFVAMLMRIRVPRGPASLMVCSLAVLVLYLLGLGLFTQLADFYDEIPAYSQRVNELVDTVADRIERVEQNAYQLFVPKRFQEAPPEGQPQVQPKRRRAREPAPPPPVQEVRIRDERSSPMNWIYGYVSSVYHTLLMISFVPFLVFFMLSWRDHISRSFYGLFQGEDRIVAGRSWRAIADMARAYVVGNFILGLIISLISAVIFSTWYLPYWVLIGFISGFLSLVPYIGLPLALIPPLAAALMTYSTLTPLVVISVEVGVLHLLALNLLYPAVVGARVHLNPLAVTVALMFWGTIWGAIGLVLAIPITAAVKAFLDNNEDYKAFGRLLGD